MFLCEILTEQQQAPPQAANISGAEVQQDLMSSKTQPAHSTQPNSYQQNDIEFDPELDSESGGEEADQSPPFQDILPLKKYYLMQKLKDLKSRLDEFNIKNTDFEIISKFMNDISYNSLLSLSINILPVVEEQLARLQINEKV